MKSIAQLSYHFATGNEKLLHNNGGLYPSHYIQFYLPYLIIQTLLIWTFNLLSSFSSAVLALGVVFDLITTNTVLRFPVNYFTTRQQPDTDKQTPSL